MGDAWRRFLRRRLAVLGLAVIAALVGDGLRDALDPRMGRVAIE